MEKLPAIIVSAFNRTEALSRLLGNINRAEYPGNVKLLISIDRSDNSSVHELANKFSWDHGEKEVILHDKNMGLKNHIMWCGDLTHEYGSIILLEDDLFLSPSFYKYAITAKEFFESDERICGIALFNPEMNESAHLGFSAINDGFDNYFMQIPCSMGQLWTRKHWQGFKEYLKNRQPVAFPARVKNWPDTTSWKKLFYEYMINEGKYFVYPQLSYSLHLGKEGTHYKFSGNLHISEIYARKTSFHFSNFESSRSIYDGFNELSPEIIKNQIPKFRGYDFETDLYGEKSEDHTGTEFLLSPRKCNNPLFSFGYEIIPPELNILFDIPGDFFHFGKKTDFYDLPYEKRYRLETMPLKDEFLYAQHTKWKKEGVLEIKKTVPYRIGWIFYSPFYWMARIFRKLRSLRK